MAASSPSPPPEPPAQFVQVRQDLPGWVEPAQAFARLRAAGHTAFLLDGLGAHPEARYAYLAVTPVQEVRVEGPFVADQGEGHSTETRGNVVGHLRHCLDTTRFPVQEEAPFTGGWVGMLGYDLATAFEPMLQRGHRDTAIPDAVLVLCLDAVVLDRRERTMRLFCADLEGDGKAAEARRQRLVQALGREATMPRWSGPGDVRWETSLSQDQFHAAAAQLKRLIHDGDLFQANLATRFSAPCDADPLALFTHLQAANPSPYMALLPFDDFAVVSGSPEQLLALDAKARVLRTRPIAGTRKRGSDPEEDARMERELLSDAKEQAEHTMLVDLLRNDVAKVSKPGSVRVPERMSVERYRHVMHLVSRVEGTLRDGLHALDALASLFPGGTVTGAPKLRACQRIREAEPVARGPYTGSAGYISWSGNAHWNILIRTVVLQDGWASVHAGSGIVADSDPEREWKEANRKARALLEAVQGHDTGAGNKTRLGEVTTHGSWETPKPPRQVKGARVLLIDNLDSFVHNLADYCALLGAKVLVVRNDADWRSAVVAFQPTHVLLSPGPGWPSDAGCTKAVATELSGQVPLLGVCLGHQAIAEAHGGHVRVHPKGPVHGQAASIEHDGAGILRGLPSPWTATRYHSLVVEPSTLGPDWAVTARLADGTIMAIEHRTHPTFGVQVHPESLCTEGGLELLANFLETKA